LRVGILFKFYFISHDMAVLETTPWNRPLRLALGHSQCKTLSQSLRHLITYYLWYFADVTTYLLKKKVEKIRLQVLFRLKVHIVQANK